MCDDEEEEEGADCPTRQREVITELAEGTHTQLVCLLYVMWHRRGALSAFN